MSFKRYLVVINFTKFLLHVFVCFRLFPFKLECVSLRNFFFSKIGLNTASYKISIWRNQYLFLLSRYVWVLLRPILHSILEREMGVETLKLVSLNMKGISNFHKRKTIYTQCRKKNADFSFLRETHSKKELETQWKNEWGAEIISGSPRAPRARRSTILKKIW